jgi:hypothetical protein
MRVAAALLSVVAAAGCASSSSIERAPVPETVRVVGGASSGAIAVGMNSSPAEVRSTALAASVADVWRVLPAAYEALGIPISVLDSTTRSVGNSGFNVRRRLGTVPLVRLIDCGTTQGGPSAESYDIRMTLTTRVRPDDAGASIATTVEALGKPVAFSGEYVRCSSTGALESRIADAVRSRLAR